MPLWIELGRCVNELRAACKNKVTFMWMGVVLVAWVVRPDLMGGVTSLVRASFLGESSYHLLLHFFHSKALPLDALRDAWIKLAFRLFSPVTINGFNVLVADGLKVPKEGEKMPAVRSLHQESNNNSKPEFIMGHSFQVVGLLARALDTDQVVAVPLVAKICEGIFRGGRSRKTILDKLVEIVLQVTGFSQLSTLLVADAAHACAKVIEPLTANGHRLVSRARHNTVAFKPVPHDEQHKGRGRPRLYGDKVHLSKLFEQDDLFHDEGSPVYGEKDVVVRIHSVDLLWRPVGHIIRFVLVKHPARGRIILICSSTDFAPIDILKAYSLRFKIEVSFKQAIHTLGTYAYRFWMKKMVPTRRRAKDQPICLGGKKYMEDVDRKIATYHRYVLLGCIAQGLVLHLAVNFRHQVWTTTRTWLRTMKPNLVPSELVVSMALKSSLPDFLLSTNESSALTKFILKHTDPEKLQRLERAA